MDSLVKNQLWRATNLIRVILENATSAHVARFVGWELGKLARAADETFVALSAGACRKCAGDQIEVTAASKPRVFTVECARCGFAIVAYTPDSAVKLWNR